MSRDTERAPQAITVASRGPAGELSQTACYVILIAAFLGWMFSGFQMAVMTLAAPSATKEFLRSGQLEGESRVQLGDWSVNIPLRFERLAAPPAMPGPILPPREGESETLKKIGGLWFSWYNAGFLLGAAAGGFVFGWLGDRSGRARSMGASIFCFSFFSAVGYFVTTPEQLLLTRFLAGMGVGGMWPTGVALASEAWSDASRPMISGLLGTSANVGLVFMNSLAYFWPPQPDAWRWMLLVCATPVVLALLVWAGVPESRRWLAAKHSPAKDRKQVTVTTVFRPPLLRLTLIGIAVGTIPVLGGWGATQWLIPWTNEVVGKAEPQAMAFTAIMRSGGAIFGGLAGGWLANLAGRRTTYFLVSLASFALGEYIYLALTPAHAAFWPCVFMLGVISTIFFGWLPLYLPELFPTEARSTGAGVSFNWGRILAAVGVLTTGVLTAAFGTYGRAGSITTTIYAVGMLVILFAPDTTKTKLRD